MTNLVLVVDDDDDLRAAIGDALEFAGYTVALAGDGRGALALLDALDRTPDLILLDLMMPVMTGQELVEHLQRDDRYQHIPIIIFSSAYANADLLSRMPAIAAVLRKPRSLDDLLIALDRVLHRGEARLTGN